MYACDMLVARAHHAMVAVEGNVYCFGGWEKPNEKSIKSEVYDKEGDSWEELEGV